MFASLKKSKTAAYQTSTVDHFSNLPVGDPSADTMPTNCALTKTTPPAPQHDWKVTTVGSLSQVEDMLDSLEAHGVAHREVLAIGNNVFAVRWR